MGVCEETSKRKLTSDKSTFRDIFCPIVLDFFISDLQDDNMANVTEKDVIRYKRIWKKSDNVRYIMIERRHDGRQGK